MSFFGLFGPPNVEKLRAKRDVQGLIKALNYKKDMSVRRAAADALRQIGNAAVEPLVVAALKGANRDVRTTAAEVLEQIDPNWRESEPAKKIVWKGMEPWVAVLKERESHYSRAWVERWQSAARALGEIGDRRATEPLVEAALTDFNNKEWTNQNRQTMVRTLRKIGDPRAVDLLVANLKHKSAHTRRAAAETLEDLKDPRAVEPLIVALDDNSEFVQIAAALALGKIGDTRAVEPLKARMWGVRRAAVVTALGQIGDVSDIEPLLVMLNSSERHERIAAIKSLGKSRDPRAIESLVKVALHEYVYDNVRNAAQEALVQMGDTRAVAPLIAELGEKRMITECLEGAQRVLRHMLQRSAANLAPEDLRALVHLEDGTRVVPESRFDPRTDGYESIDTTVTVEFSQLRQLAQKELARRGLQA